MITVTGLGGSVESSRTPAKQQYACATPCAILFGRLRRCVGKWATAVVAVGVPGMCDSSEQIVNSSNSSTVLCGALLCVPQKM